MRLVASVDEEDRSCGTFSARTQHRIDCLRIRIICWTMFAGLVASAMWWPIRQASLLQAMTFCTRRPIRQMLLLSQRESLC